MAWSEGTASNIGAMIGLPLNFIPGLGPIVGAGASFLGQAMDMAFADKANPYEGMMDAKNPMYKQIGQSVYSGMSRAGRETAEEAKKRMYQQGFGGQIAGAGYKKDIQASQQRAYDASQNAIFNALDNNFNKYIQGMAAERETNKSYSENLIKSAIPAAMFAYMKQGNNNTTTNDDFNFDFKMQGLLGETLGTPKFNSGMLKTNNINSFGWYRR